MNRGDICMSYNSLVVSNPNLLEDDMKNCIQCNVEFYGRHCGLACSLKCKILSNIQKQENGCWIYKGATSGPYGKIRWNVKWHSAHRISYEQFVGPIQKDKWVCHKCDTPKCVNPDHLFLGSPSDNHKDAIAKKRVPIGEKSHWAKFTDKQIKEMRLLKQEGFTYERLSIIFNCSYTFVCDVIKKKIRK